MSGGESDDESAALREGRPAVAPFDAGDARAHAAWRAWLAALATDAEAALAAAMTYGALEDGARDAWLDALDADASAIEVPRVAIYAPLLAVETDGARRARIADAMGEVGTRAPATVALRGESASGDAVCAIATPLYLDFVELLVCRYRPDEGIVSASHDPFRHAAQLDAAIADALLEPARVSRADLRAVVEELAHAIVADRRAGRAAPAALARFSHLFGPDLRDSDGGNDHAPPGVGGCPAA